MTRTQALRMAKANKERKQHRRDHASISLIHERHLEAAKLDNLRMSEAVDFIVRRGFLI